MKTIYFTKKNVFGKELYYPGCKESEIFCRIAGKKTLDIYEFVRIEALGFTIEFN